MEKTSDRIQRTMIEEAAKLAKAALMSSPPARPLQSSISPNMQKVHLLLTFPLYYNNLWFAAFSIVSTDWFTEANYGYFGGSLWPCPHVSRVNALLPFLRPFLTLQHINILLNTYQQQQLLQQQQQQQQRQEETNIDVKMSTALSAIYKNSNQDRYQHTSHHSSHVVT